MNFLRRSFSLTISEIQNSLRGGSISFFIGLMLANAVAYGYPMFMARMMAPADYWGLVTLSSISYVLAVVARTFQAWIIKAVCTKPPASAGQVHAAFTAAMRTVIPLGTAVLLGHWFASGWVADFLRLEAHIPVIVL